MIADCTRACRTQGGCGATQPVMHRPEVGATVHSAEIGRGARVVLSVSGRLRVGDRVRALHTG